MRFINLILSNFIGQLTTSMVEIYTLVAGSVFDKLIWCTIGPMSFLFGTYCTVLSLSQMALVIIVTNSINSLLIDSRCIPNGSHANHC